MLALAAGLAVTAAPALAQSLADQVVAQLRRQGYAQISVSRTFLGRIRIEAANVRHSREIILNPRTGEYLRDYSELADGESEVEIIDRGDGAGRDDGADAKDGANDGANDGPAWLRSSDGGSSGEGSSVRARAAAILGLTG